jgi:8-oxo-dGTP pyrophosphatase MutT (NUDIX family)
MTAEQEGAGGEEQPKRRARRRRRRRRKPAQASGAAAVGTSRAKSKQETSARAGKRGKTDAKEAAGKKRVAKRATPGKGPVQKEVSAGGVIYRREGDGIEVVLASRRTRRGDLAWGLAKGGIEEGETVEDAAVREVREETGLEAEIEADLGDTKYFYVWDDVRIRKTVHFFLMRHAGGDTDDRDDEMEEVRWFPLERALKRAAYRGERDVLQRAAELLR